VSLYLLKGHGTYYPVHQFPVFEKEHGGDALDLIFSGALSCQVEWDKVHGSLFKIPVARCRAETSYQRVYILYPELLFFPHLEQQVRAEK